MKLLKLYKPAQVLALLLLATFPLWAASPSKVTQPDLLDAEQAFQVSARFLDGNTVELSYRIADGYYMYRNRFKFASEEGKPAWGKAWIPAGKFKQDATFGRVETYRKNVRILLPLAISGGGKAVSGPAKLIVLQVISQGCADAGVCYPPQRHEFRLERGSMATALPFSANGSEFSSAGTQGAASGLAPASGRISDLIKRVP